MQLPLNFGGLPEEHARLDGARFVVIPAPYEGTTTYLKGTARGPSAVIDASRNLELWDEELLAETFREGIHTLPTPELEPLAPEVVVERLERLAGPVLDRGQVAVTIGGEHSISLGPVRAARARHPTLSVLQLDAHTDLRDEYDGTKYGHGCVMRRILGLGCRLVQVGIRSLSTEEAELVSLGAEGRLRTFFARDLVRPGSAGVAGSLDAILAGLDDPVYLSVDVDAFDPAFVPGTGTPEPGGLSWWDVTAILAAVTAARRVVGFDVVETIPLEGQAVSEFLAAKLVYRIMGYVARGRGSAGVAAGR